MLLVLLEHYSDVIGSARAMMRCISLVHSPLLWPSWRRACYAVVSRDAVALESRRKEQTRGVVIGSIHIVPALR